MWSSNIDFIEFNYAYIQSPNGQIGVTGVIAAHNVMEVYGKEIGSVLWLHL